MPIYNFKCNSCKHNQEITLSVKELIEYKEDKPDCPACQKGRLIQHIISFGSKIERSLDQFKMKADEEVKQIAKKIKEGDQELFKDIYGEDLNPHKKRITGAIDED